MVVHRLSAMRPSRQRHRAWSWPARLRSVAAHGRRSRIRPARRSHARYARVLCVRAEITRRLIEECGFDAVAVEADWPDACRLNRCVRDADDASIGQASGDFQRSRFGCGATGPCKISSDGCTRTTRRSPRTRVWVSTAWTCIACTGRRKRSSNAWRRSIPSRRPWPVGFIRACAAGPSSAK